MEMQIYHYKEQGEWIPFSLNNEDSKKWNQFCSHIQITRPKEPNPNRSDLELFFNQLKHTQNND